MLWLLFLNFLFNLSFQTQLFREFAGLTVQNLQAQASEWTLSDPSGTLYSPTISDCIDDKIVIKPASLPTGTTFKKTFDNLEDHNVIRFFLKMYYMGGYTSQTVDIKFDDTTYGTSKVLPLRFPPEFFSCSSMTFGGNILYYGTLPHNDSSVTVEFSSNLHDSSVEINWGLRDFSLVADISDIPEPSPVIYSQSFLSENTGVAYPCFVGSYPDEQGDCFSCVSPCANCFGSDPDQCFAYLYDSPEMRLCPAGQTFTKSGCVPCIIENCTYCDKDVTQCDTCLTTCAQCDNSGPTPQCQECTVESNLVLYEGNCIDSCPQGTYQDPDRKCQLCQAGCLECTSPEQCLQCDTSETHLNLNDLCICNQAGLFYEKDSAQCTGTCLLGCGNCLNSEECLLCNPGLLIQPNGDCKCFQDGFYYQDETGDCTGQCPNYCNYCHDGTSCLECSGSRVPKDGMCKCELPRILIGTNCECPAYMVENSDTMNCEYIDLIDIAYQSTVSPLFDAILLVHINPLKKWTTPISITWMIDCTFQNSDIRDLFQNYMSMQNNDLLLIPSSFLEYSFQCAVYASYTSDNGLEISKALIFETLSSLKPQVLIVGGPFQMFDHTEVNFIFAEVKSSTGKILSSSDVQIKWTQTEGDDQLNMNSIFSSSKPFQLKIPKCLLSQGELYKFKLSVTLKSNSQTTSQEVTIGVYAPKIQTQIIGLTDNYHLSSKSLNLQAQLYLQEDDKCSQKTQLSDLIDSSTAMYTWECFFLDLDLPTTNRLLDETPQITDDTNILIHPDPLKLFYRSTNSPTITIPKSYFTLYPGYQFIFYLTVTVQSSNPTPTIKKFNIQQPSLYTPKNNTSVRIVTSKPSIQTPTLTCISENNCRAYSDDFQTKFLSDSPYNSQYSYNYLLSTFGAFQVKTSYTTFLTIASISPSWGSKIVPQILFTISDGISIASAFFVLPWNNSPQSGFINVYPTEGKAYKTRFFLSTSGWIDADLPVSYEFYTTYDSDRNMMMKTLNSYDETILLSQPYYSYCYVGVLVKDNLKSISQQTAFVPLTGEAQSLCDALSKSSEALSSTSKYQNLYQRFRLIQMIMENLNRWEWFDSESTCNVTEIEFKFTIITEMKDLFLALDSKEELKLLLLSSLNLATDPNWNQDSNWVLYINIIDSYFQAASSTSILPSGEYNILFPILDNLINYMKKPGTSIEDPAKIFVYINTLLRSTLNNAIPTDTSVAYYGAFYSIFTIRTTYCKVLQELTFLPYGRLGLEANVTLLPGKTIPIEKCNDQIDLIFMAFRPNYTITGETYEAQTLIYFDLRDSVTGESLFDIFTFILVSPVYTCPDGGSCNPGGGGGTEIYGIFDLKDQVNKIFAKSNIAQIQNISVLGHFHFWESVAFWTVLAFSAWFLASFYWLSVKHPTYCALQANKNLNKQSFIKRILLFFWVAHPLVGIYLYNDPKIAKSTKLAIYYQRLVIVMVFSTIFSSIEHGEGAIFKAYIVLFNALTVTPINAILSRIFQWALNSNRKSSSKKKLTSKIKLFLAIFFYLALLIGCFIIMFIIEAQQDASQNKGWALNFIIAFGQDLSLSPFMSLFNKVSFFKLSQTGRFLRLLKYPRVIKFFIPKNFRSIYQTIFVNIAITTTVNDDCQSPRITTMSPLSTDRKLLRFSTADLQAPASPRIHSPYEFRSRRASETEMNTVDFVATEALVSNRFQTFFSEAKPETVKEFNPIMKENYSKMQSSNLYSSTYTNTKLQQSLGGNPKSLLMKLEKFKTKPIASIVFHPETEPAEINPEEIFSFGENTETMYASQPKTWKNGKTMESSIHKKAKKNKKNESKRCETVV